MLDALTGQDVSDIIFKTKCNCIIVYMCRVRHSVQSMVLDMLYERYRVRRSARGVVLDILF